MGSEGSQSFLGWLSLLAGILAVCFELMCSPGLERCYFPVLLRKRAAVYTLGRKSQALGWKQLPKLCDNQIHGSEASSQIPPYQREQN